MLYTPKNHKELTQFMQLKGYFRLPYNIDFEGTKVVTNLKSSQGLTTHLYEN